ncbi:uncharacterized protein LOC115342807 [Aquila chrysaetos chrysaetos]|uniref:uncharacterized protein LOC115342807 n=1 Tax=Aquila chrysaetos chrysaetos TaxID=223781 RepID=UPI0011772677|nr:uncharacterized protein LOC115342807 [Aquila chrysaetos chrysaetos]
MNNCLFPESSWLQALWSEDPVLFPACPLLGWWRAASRLLSAATASSPSAQWPGSDFHPESQKALENRSTKKRVNNVAHGTKAFRKDKEIHTMGLLWVLEKVMQSAYDRFQCSRHTTVSISGLLEITLRDAQARPVPLSPSYWQQLASTYEDGQEEEAYRQLAREQPYQPHRSSETAVPQTCRARSKEVLFGFSPPVSLSERG